MLNVKNLLRKITIAIYNCLNLETETASITATAGSLNNVICHRYGPIIVLGFSPLRSSSVSAGSNVATGTLNTAKLLPLHQVTCVTYYGLRAISTLLEANGNITVRNSSNSNLSANSGIRSTLIYISKEWLNIINDATNF